MDWAGWAVFGLVATAALTAAMIAAQLAGLTRLDLPLVLGTLVTEDPDRARVVGFFVHLIAGQGFALGVRGRVRPAGPRYLVGRCAVRRTQPDDHAPVDLFPLAGPGGRTDDVVARGSRWGEELGLPLCLAQGCQHRRQRVPRRRQTRRGPRFPGVAAARQPAGPATTTACRYGSATAPPTSTSSTATAGWSTSPGCSSRPATARGAGPRDRGPARQLSADAEPRRARPGRTRHPRQPRLILRPFLRSPHRTVLSWRARRGAGSFPRSPSSARWRTRSPCR